MTQESLTIGVLAKKSGVNIETIRFYQRRGLLREPPRPLKGIRRYTEGDVRRVRFIKEGQKLGFSLAEVAELLSLEDGQHCSEAKDVAIRKLVLIRERIERLRMMASALSGLIESCARNSGSVSCPIILALLRASEQEGVARPHTP
jgi:MerR family mercuric resistance operon transcriptional regulator